MWRSLSRQQAGLGSLDESRAMAMTLTDAAQPCQCGSNTVRWSTSRPANHPMNVASPVDLRSDTVTRPSPGMRAAIAAAPVGDDQYGDDPTVNALQERIAAL